jgi:hypothetical protein
MSKPPMFLQLIKHSAKDESYFALHLTLELHLRAFNHSDVLQLFHPLCR